MIYTVICISVCAPAAPFGVRDGLLRRTRVSERPGKVSSRAGALVRRSDCGVTLRSAIATLVERQTRFTMLVHFPGDPARSQFAMGCWPS